MADYVKLATQQLPQLMDILQPFLPDTLPIYYTADNTVRGRLSLEEVQFYVDSWPNLTCVAVISPSQCGQLFNYRTTVDVWAKDISMVQTFLCNTTVLDWSQPIFFRVPHLCDTKLKALKQSLDEKRGTCSFVERHIYTLSSSPSRNPLPPGYTLLEKLDQSDAETVGQQYSAWGVDPKDTVHYFQVCASRLPSSGIHTESGELVSYVALHHTSAFGSVVTDSKHQRKGLGKAVVTDISWKMKADGQMPYVYVNPENIASAKLYERCGFEVKAVAYRGRFVPCQE